MVTGEAAGVAAALAARHGVVPRNVDLAELQSALRALDVKLRPADLQR
jgi:FAD-dependent oxidoreductase family protein